MPRRYTPKRRPNVPDPRYNSVLVYMFIQRMIRGGKRSTALGVIYGALEMVEGRAKKEPVSVLETAISNVAPTVEVKPRRVGGSTYQVPVEVSRERGEGLAIRWLLAAAQSRGGRSFAERLSAEILDAASGTGTAVKKREETHKMAEANRAFAHYKW